MDHVEGMDQPNQRTKPKAPRVLREFLFEEMENDASPSVTDRADDLRVHAFQEATDLEAERWDGLS